MSLPDSLKSLADVRDCIRALEQRYGVEVYALLPFGENRTWGVNVQFHRLKDGAFLEVRPRQGFALLPSEYEQFCSNGGIVRA